MKTLLNTLVLMLCAGIVLAQSDEQRYYYDAKTALENMLSGKEQASYEGYWTMKYGIGCLQKEATSI